MVNIVHYVVGLMAIFFLCMWGLQEFEKEIRKQVMEEIRQAAPVHSTRRILVSGTVKSNIEGVITLNDDCKITVIGEE